MAIITLLINFILLNYFVFTFGFFFDSLPLFIPFSLPALGIIYPNREGERCFMRMSQLDRFSDDTLLLVRNILADQRSRGRFAPPTGLVLSALHFSTLSSRSTTGWSIDCRSDEWRWPARCGQRRWLLHGTSMGSLVEASLTCISRLSPNFYPKEEIVKPTFGLYRS